MALLLNIDTSSPVCSVCIADRGIVIAEISDHAGNQHATKLTALIEEALKTTGCTYKDLKAIAVSDGPGSYTGLRIGASIAKGLCYGLAIPMIAVPTLQGLAYKMATLAPGVDHIYIPMTDARREDVYMAVYDSSNRQIEQDACVTVTYELITDTYDKYKKPIYGGSGAHKAKKGVENEFGTVIENVVCEASNIAYISYIYLLSKKLVDFTYYEPSYLKEFTGRIKSN